LFFFFEILSFTKKNLSKKIKNKNLLNSHLYLKNRNLGNILEAQFNATQNVFIKKKIPFRSFFIEKKNEQTLGELFTFFILETILLGKALNVNPYDQPSVELIKVNTKKILTNY